MKFVCERCQTKYSIADEKVRQKVLKIRCKTCENVITIRDAVVVSEPAVVRSEPPPTPAQAPRSVEWHLAISGQQSGPFGLSALVSRIAAAGRNDEIYVWNEHLDGWKEPRLIPEVAAEMRLRAASLEPPAPPAAARRTLTPMAGHSQLPRGGSPAPAAAMRGGRSGAMAAAAKLQPEESADAIFEEKTQISPLDASVMLGGTEARPQTGRGLGISAHGARPEIRRPESRTTEHAPTESRRTEAKPAGKSDGTAGKARDKAAEPKPVNKTFEETKPADLKHPADLGMASLLSVLPASNGQGARKTTGAATAAASGLEALDFAPPLVAPSSQPAIDFPAAARNGVPTPVVGGNTSMLLAQVGAKASKPRHPAVKYGIVGLLAVGLVGVIVVVATSDGDKKPTVKAENTT
ncbi:MAG TPA: zinc-ribbon domain-containing protein, partial [Polyangia bacterium]